MYKTMRNFWKIKAHNCMHYISMYFMDKGDMLNHCDRCLKDA